MKQKQHLRNGLTRRCLLKCGFCGGMAAGLSSAFALGGCGKPPRTDKAGSPNVLLISLDTVRRDHCSIYGYERATTPNLAVFAEQGTSFDLAYAPSSTTAPTHATVFTGLYPVAHRVVKNGLVLSAEHETLAEILNTEGYQTASIVSSFVLHSKFGYGQGFEYYDDDFPRSEATMEWDGWKGHEVKGGFDRRADHTTNRAIHWLRRRRDSNRPFLLFVHYFDPHNPYKPPGPFASRFASGEASDDSLEKNIGLYDGEIAFTDQEVARLLAALEQAGLDEDTLVVVFSDHGEGLMNHGHMYHGVRIYEESVRVPFLLRWPGRIPESRLLSAPVSLIDLLPTVLELVGVESEGRSFQGRSLAASICGDVPLEPEQPIYLYRRHYEEGRVQGIPVAGEKFGIRVGEWKYIEGVEENTRELFNLSSDPAEKTNLYVTSTEKAAELASRLREWKRSHVKKILAQPSISEEDLARLRSLGYTD